MCSFILYFICLANIDGCILDYSKFKACFKEGLNVDKLSSSLGIQGSLQFTQRGPRVKDLELSGEHHELNTLFLLRYCPGSYNTFNNCMYHLIGNS